MVSYDEFSKLRLRDFYPIGERLFHEDRGFECALGFSGYEGDVSAYFAWPVERPEVIGEMFLSFRDDLKECPCEIAQDVMNAIRLPLRPKMSKEEVFGIVGEAVQIENCPNGVTAFDFICDGVLKSRYSVRCYIHDISGLIALGVVREDMLER